jgi:hypothetical protein
LKAGSPTCRNEKPGHEGRVSLPSLARRLLLEEAEFLIEARHAAATVHEALLATGPGRVGLRIDVKVQRVADLALSGTGHELGAIGHDNRDGMVIGMDAGLHGASL